jgi:diguanylate cyclase (GGDEF)-like protein/PAS domain S-box-containing protein
MDAKASWQREMDDTLYMITSAQNEVQYIAPICQTQLDITATSDTHVSWQQLVPEKYHRQLMQAMQQVLAEKCTQTLSLSKHPQPSPAISLCLVPLCDQNGDVATVIWFGAKGDKKANHHADMFHRSAIAQWIMDVASVYCYLHTLNIFTVEQLDAAVILSPYIVSHLRQLLRVIDANETAALLYNMKTIEQFKIDIIANATDKEIVRAAYAILGAAEKNQRQTFQTELTLEGSEKKSLWISCEIPASDNVDVGLFISVLNITLLKQAENESEERQQFLATILRAVPDILMVFDFKHRKPIFQNVDLTKLLGYTDQDLEDTQGHILSYIAHPDDTITGDSLRAMYAQLADGEVYETTLRLQHNNGEWHHFYFRSAALDKDEDGNILNAVVVARDITEVLKAQQILTEQQQRYQILADNFSDVVITLDTRFQVDYVSPSVTTLLGINPEAFIADRNSLRYLGFTYDDIDRMEAILASTLFRVDNAESDFAEVQEKAAVAIDGRSIPIELKLSILRDEHNLLEGVLLVVRDITERQKVDEARRLAAKVFENSTEAIYITDHRGDIVQVNDAFVDITGYKAEKVIGMKPSQLSSGWHSNNFIKDIKPVLDSSGHWSGEIMSRRASGEAFLVWMSISNVLDSRGALIGMITSFRDITEAKSSEESIRKLAYYDPLTDLPNRMLFHDRLSQALQRANRNRHYIAVLFMDLDGFKEVNDILGHAVGDRLLTEAAKRLKECIRSDDTVARMGGDEFTVILNALVSREAAESAAAQVANKILSVLNENFVFEDKVAKIGASIGIALYPDDANEESHLIKLADTAMYHAKEMGKNNYQFYTNDMHQRAEQRQLEEVQLRKALEQNELVLAFQPKLMAQNKKLVGFEALLRWQHPKRGLLMPSHFMRALDDLSLSADIGRWVIDAACEQLAGWVKQGKADIGVSVNIFAHHYRSPEFKKSIIASIKKYHVPAELITIELKEALIMEDLGFAYSVLTDLKECGVRIAIDDFAIGTLSLVSLNRLPIDEIKIDRQFISQINHEGEHYRLVKAIIALANTFNFDVVAEGVEDESQLQALLNADCPKVQGYLFYRPLSQNDLVFFLQKKDM